MNVAFFLFGMIGVLLYMVYNAIYHGHIIQQASCKVKAPIMMNLIESPTIQVGMRAPAIERLME
jgi:hypothetical protein